MKFMTANLGMALQSTTLAGMASMATLAGRVVAAAAGMTCSAAAAAAVAANGDAEMDAGSMLALLCFWPV